MPERFSARGDGYYADLVRRQVEGLLPAGSRGAWRQRLGDGDRRADGVDGEERPAIRAATDGGEG